MSGIIASVFPYRFPRGMARRATENGRRVGMDQQLFKWAANIHLLGMQTLARPGNNVSLAMERREGHTTQTAYNRASFLPRGTLART